MSFQEEKARITKAKTPYETLLLSPNATPEEAKYQYFSLIKKFSPEREEDAFRLIRKAFEDLRDPARKAAVDVMIMAPLSGKLRFNGVTITTNSQVKLEKDIKELETKSEAEPGDQVKLIDLVKQKILLLAKNRRWNSIPAELSRLEKLGDLSEELSNIRSIAISMVACQLAEKGHYSESANRWRGLLNMLPGNSRALHNLAICATLSAKREDEDKYWPEVLKAWHRELSEKGDDEYLKSLILETHKRFGGRFLKQVGDENLRNEIKSPPADRVHSMGSGSSVVGETKPEVSPQPPPQVNTASRGSSPLRLALSAYEQQNWKSAIANFEAHLTQQPSDGEAIDKMAWAYLRTGKANEAFKMWQELVNKNNQPELARESYAQAKLETARSLRERKMISPALVQLKDALKMAPECSDIYRELAEIYKSRNDWVNTSYYYEKALDFSPNDKELRQAFRMAQRRSRTVR